MMLSAVALALAFIGFMAVVWSVHRLDHYAGERYGYQPFALPNAALMCIPSLLLYSALSASAGALAPDQLFAAIGAAGAVKLTVWGLFLIAMFGLLSWRTNLWIAAYAAPLLALAAPVILMTVLYGRLSS